MMRKIIYCLVLSVAIAQAQTHRFGSMPYNDLVVTNETDPAFVAWTNGGFQGVGGSGVVWSVNGQTGAVAVTATSIGAVPTTRTITVNGSVGTLSSNLSFTVALNTNVPTLQQVTTAGASTTNTVTFGGGITNLIPGLALHYKMNDNAASQTVVDNFGGYNGFSVRNTSAMSTAGKINNALYFNGSDYVTNAHQAIWTRAPQTMAVWAKAESISVGAGAFSIFQNSTADSDGGMTILLSNGLALFSTYTTALNTGVTIDTAWHHYAVVTIDGTNWTAYIDGKSVVSGPVPPLADHGGMMEIGAANNTALPFYGAVDDVRFYTNALTAAQIKNIYNGTAGTEQDIVAVVPEAYFDASGNLTFQFGSVIYGLDAAGFGADPLGSAAAVAASVPSDDHIYGLAYTEIYTLAGGLSVAFASSAYYADSCGYAGDAGFVDNISGHNVSELNNDSGYVSSLSGLDGSGLIGITASQVGAVPTTRTIAVNGTIGTLTSNLAFTVAGVQNGQNNVLFGAANFTGDVSIAGNLYVVNEIVSNKLTVATNIAANNITASGTITATNGLYCGANAVLTNAAAFDASGAAAAVTNTPAYAYMPTNATGSYYTNMAVWAGAATNQLSTNANTLYLTY